MPMRDSIGRGRGGTGRSNNRCYLSDPACPHPSGSAVAKHYRRPLVRVRLREALVQEISRLHPRLHTLVARQMMAFLTARIYMAAVGRARSA